MQMVQIAVLPMITTTVVTTTVGTDNNQANGSRANPARIHGHYFFNYLQYVQKYGSIIGVFTDNETECAVSVDC